MSVAIVKSKNYDADVVASALDQAFTLLGLDPDNPFKDIVAPGNRVFVKPNWVAHRYRASCPQQFDLYTSITHPNVIATIVRKVDKALGGDGEIVVGDNPSIDADFPVLMKQPGLENLKDECKSKVSFLDLRPLVCKDLKDYGLKHKMHKQQGDPLGVNELNLGKTSMLYGLEPRLFRGVFTDQEETINAHSGDNHIYGISRSIYDADVFISIPKLKTHHKTGVTLNLKGLVGTMGIKNYLVHWRNGFPNSGGDAYPNFDAWYNDQYKDVKKRGAWHGNDTIWRMVVDLYRCFLNNPNQKRFTVIDGIMGGDCEGPFCPEPQESGVLLAGHDFLETDIIGTRLMGFDPMKVPFIKYFVESENISIKDIPLCSDFVDKESFFDLGQDHLAFNPPRLWKILKGV